MDYKLANVMYELHLFLRELDGEQKEQYRGLIEELQEVLTCGQSIKD